MFLNKVPKSIASVFPVSLLSVENPYLESSPRLRKFDKMRNSREFHWIMDLTGPHCNTKRLNEGKALRKWHVQFNRKSISFPEAAILLDITQKSRPLKEIWGWASIGYSMRTIKPELVFSGSGFWFRPEGAATSDQPKTRGLWEVID